MVNTPPPGSEQDQAHPRPNYPRNSLCGLPPELREELVDCLPVVTQKQLRLVNTTFCQHATPRVFKRVVVPETAGGSSRDIPKSIIANNTTSISILKKEVDAHLLVPGSAQNTTNESFNIKEKPPPAFRESFIQELFTNIPQVDEICIEHPISLRNLQTMLNMVGTRLRSLSITDEAFSVTVRKRGGLQLLATAAATTELERLRLTPVGSPSILEKAEECALATVISRSSATLRYLDLGWVIPVEPVSLPAVLGDCRRLTTLNLNGLGRECANILPSLFANNPGLKSLCLQGMNVASEPADGSVARAFIAFEGTFSRLEITCVHSVPNWLYSANCLKSLSTLFIHTTEAGNDFAGWIAGLGELQCINFKGVKFESNVDYRPCLSHATSLQLYDCELSFNTLSQLVCPASALASLSFSDVYLVDYSDNCTFDFINTILDQPAVQALGRKFAAATTPPKRDDITMRLALRSKNRAVSDDQPVPFYLKQVWLESRSRDTETEVNQTDMQHISDLVSTDEEFGIVTDDSSGSGSSGQSLSSSLDMDEFQVQGDSLAGEDENSSSAFSLIPMARDFVTGDDQRDSEIDSLDPLQDISNKRNRSTFGGTGSGDDERPSKRLCVGESNSIDSSSSSGKMAAKNKRKGVGDENEENKCDN